MITFPPHFNDPQQTESFNDFLTLEEIKTLEKDLSNIPFEKAAIGNESLNSKHHIRSSNVKWVPFDIKYKWIYDKIMDSIHKANSYIWKFDLKDSPEQLQFTEYKASEKGHYGWHVDNGPNYASLRKISVTVQLSDPEEYEGGHLQMFNFAELNPLIHEKIPNNPTYIKTIKKHQGAITVFPSYIPHRITPVTKGIRKSLVLWVGGTPFK